MNRDCRFELLRIVAILLITLHHLLLFGADVCGFLSPYNPEEKGVLGVALNSVAVVGVSLFVMISGWFGIRSLWKPFFRLIAVCAAFGALAYCLAAFVLPPVFAAIAIVPEYVNTQIDLFNSLKFTNWWFIVHYLLLILAAPLLEAALQHADRRQMERALLALMVGNLVFGFAWGYVNASGYNVVHFVLLYVLARYMRLCPDVAVVRIVRRFAWPIIALCVAAMVGLFLADSAAWQPRHAAVVWNYNCPLVLLEAMAIFSLFADNKWCAAAKTRRAVNFVAAFVLGVYLLQSAPIIVHYRNAIGHAVFERTGYVGLFALAISLAALCWVLSCALLLALRPLLRLMRLQG